MIPKYKMLTAYAKSFIPEIFIETGTFKGHAVKYMLLAERFSRLYTIDAVESRVSAAKKRFRNFPHVYCHHGDSPEVLAAILARIDEPVLFWLDAHYIGTKEDRGEVSTPLIQELDVVLGRNVNDVILIDDARLFSTERLKGFPNKQQIITKIKSAYPDWTVRTSGDVIQACYVDDAKTR